MKEQIAPGMFAKPTEAILPSRLFVMRISFYCVIQPPAETILHDCRHQF